MLVIKNDRQALLFVPLVKDEVGEIFEVVRQTRVVTCWHENVYAHQLKLGYHIMI